MENQKDDIFYWNSLRGGDKQALFSLYNSLYFHLIRFGLKICADDELTKDCVNQLFLNIWDRKERLPEVKNAKVYLFAVLKNLLIDEISNSIKINNAVGFKVAQDDFSELSYEEILIKVQSDDELKAKLRNAIQKLTPKQIELVHLKFFEGLTYEQIALRTSQSIKTSYNTIYDAVKSLKKLLS